MTTTLFDDAVEIEGSQDITQLTIEGYATQTNPLQSWQANGGTELAQLTGDGRFQIGSFDSGMMATDESLIEAHRHEDDTSKPKRGFHLLGTLKNTLTSMVAWVVHELILKGTSGISAAHTALRVHLRNEATGTMGGSAELRGADIEVLNESEDEVPTLMGLRVNVGNTDVFTAGTLYGIKVELNNPPDEAYALHTNGGKVRLGGLEAGALAIDEDGNLISVSSVGGSTTRPGTAGETLAQRALVFFNPADNAWYLIDTNTTPVACGALRGVVVADGGIAEDAAGDICTSGLVDGFTSLTPGLPVYASTTPGGYTQTKPTLTAGGGQVAVVRMGMAVSATEINVQPMPMQYMVRELLDDEELITLEHHADALAYSRKVSAYPSVDVDIVFTEYGASNQNKQVAVKKPTPGYSANIASGYTATASADASGAYPASNAFDGDPASVWYTGTSALPQWLRYQFPSARIIRQYALQCSSSGGHQIYTPSAWTFEGSNDGSTWTVLDTQTGQTSWGLSEIRSFPVVHNTAYAYYRLNVSAVNGSGGECIVGNFLMMEIGEFSADQCTGGTPSASNTQSPYVAANAFSDTTTNPDVWYSGGATFPIWIQYQMTSGKIIRGYSIRADNGGGNQNYCPTQWTFQGSNNGSTWTTLDTVSVSGWGLGQIRYFAFANSTSYTYYRINVTATTNGSPNGVLINEIEMFEATNYTNGSMSVAQGFQVGASGNIVSIKVHARKVGTPTAATRLKIRANNSGDPGSVLATSQDIAASAWGTSNADIEYTFSSPYAASASTQYWVELEYDGSQDEFNHLEWGIDDTSPDYSGGVLKTYNGSAWSAPGADAIFAVLAADTHYEGQFSVGAWVEPASAVLNRFDDGEDANPETNTTFKNNSGQQRDITFVVELP